MAELPLPPPPSSLFRNGSSNRKEGKEVLEEDLGGSECTRELRSWHRLDKVHARIEQWYDSITEKQVDEGLEWLRRTNKKFPVLAQVILNWAAVSIVFLYYSWAYYRARRGGGAEETTRTVARLPLMTEAATAESRGDLRHDDAGDKGSDDSEDALLRETHAKLRELLSQQGLLSSNPSSPHRFVPPSTLRTPERDSDPNRPLVVNQEEWIQEIRQDSILRRLVSRFMQHETSARQLDSTLFDVLDGIYERLIPLPSPAPQQWQVNNKRKDERGDVDNTYLYELSAIVPCHDSEPVESVRRTIESLWRHCRHPERVQLVLVHAVDASPSTASSRLDLTALLNEVRDQRSSHATTRPWWGDAKCVTYRGGGGRGPALNLGAVCSQGQILVFVHSDCQLPKNWDRKISTRILSNPSVSATSFLLGVDCSGTSWIRSLLFGSTDNENAVIAHQYPWGILAVQIMVNLRTYFLRMPYGDQAIAMRSSYFSYIGGFPNQPIMEDFDFMSYLRRRATYLENREHYSLIGSVCWSSPRRWQKVGVLYVTVGNAILVHRYTRKHNRWSPQRVFDYYYNKKRPTTSKETQNGSADKVRSHSNASNSDKLD